MWESRMKAVSAKYLIVASTLIAMVAVCAVIIWRMNTSDSGQPASPDGSHSESVSPSEAVSEPANPQKLVGRWIRTDSPYVIEIHEVSPDGTLRAGYYNPRPINVAVAKAQNKDGRLQVFVELNDVGYPGSNYTLNYDPQNDALQGTYFQATMQQNYDIAFMRMPSLE